VAEAVGDGLDELAEVLALAVGLGEPVVGAALAVGLGEPVVGAALAVGLGVADGELVAVVAFTVGVGQVLAVGRGLGWLLLAANADCPGIASTPTTARAPAAGKAIRLRMRVFTLGDSSSDAPPPWSWR
jgi:hypothetical protein